MTTSEPPKTSEVDPQNPWPGLVSYTEELHDRFFGRDGEAETLLRMIKRERLTVLFGQSGLGKTSLLMAGLFPRLRLAEFLPVYIRLEHSPEAPCLVAQVRAAISKALATHHIDGPTAVEGETLWEYFHRKESDFWTATNRLTTPVLVFDQFEEVFTVGCSNEATRARGEAFLKELADLVENRPPAAVKARLEQESGESDSRFDYDKTTCKVVLSLREDYLPEFESLRPSMRSIMSNRSRLNRMSGLHAIEVVERAGDHLLEPGVAEAIVRFVAASGEKPGDNGLTPADLKDMEIEPFLLSLVCRELNNRRREFNLPRITPELLAGTRREILTDFYERCMRDVTPQFRAYIEDKLLTNLGFRDSVARESALMEPDVTSSELELLINRRLLRMEDRGGVQRIELTHDVLTEPIRASRDHRRRREELARAKGREIAVRKQLAKARRRLSRIIAISGIGAVLLVAVAAHWRALSTRAEEQRLHAEESRYADDMRLALDAAENGNFGRAMEFLLRYRPDEGKEDLRGFEWRYLWRRCEGASDATYRGHSDQVRSVAYSPDGKFVVTGSADSTVRILDVGQQKEVGKATLDGSGVMCIAISPDGKTLACATGNWKNSAVVGNVYLVDVDTRRIVTSLQGHDKTVNSVAFSNDGKLLVTASEDNTVRVWARSGTNKPMITFAGHSGGANKALFSPDSTLVAAGSGDGTFQVWELKSRKLIADSIVNVSGIMSLAFAPDGKMLLLGTRDGPVLFWNVHDRKIADKRDPKQGLINCIAFSRDGREFATAGSDCTIKLWNTADRSVKPKTLRGHQDLVFSVAFSPTESRLASGSGDQTVKLWNTERKFIMPTLTQHAAVTSLAIAPGGKMLASADGESIGRVAAKKPEIHLWSVVRPTKETGVLRGHTDIIYSVAFAPDGATLASGGRDNTVMLWDVEKGLPLQTLTGQTGAVFAVKFSPDGKLLATGSGDTSIRLWKIVDHQAQPAGTLSGHTGRVRALDFSPDGRLLASASSDGTVRLWSVESQKNTAVLTGYQGACNAVHFSPDGRLLATASFDRTVRLWNASARHYDPADAVILQGYSAAINCVAFSPDGKTLAAGSQDSTVALWNVDSNEEVGVYQNHEGGVLCIGFSPDGNLMATGSNDESIVLWRAVGPTDMERENSTWTRP